MPDTASPTQTPRSLTGTGNSVTVDGRPATVLGLRLDANLVRVIFCDHVPGEPCSKDVPSAVLVAR